MVKNRETNVAEFEVRAYWNEPCRNCGHPRHSHKVKYTHEPKYLGLRITTQCRVKLAVEPGVKHSVLLRCSCFRFAEKKNEELKAVLQ